MGPFLALFKQAESTMKQHETRISHGCKLITRCRLCKSFLIKITLGIKYEESKCRLMEKEKVINNYVLSIFTCGMLEVPIRNFRHEATESVLISVRIQGPSQVWSMRQPHWDSGFLYAYGETELVYLFQLLTT